MVIQLHNYHCYANLLTRHICINNSAIYEKSLALFQYCVVKALVIWKKIIKRMAILKIVYFVLYLYPGHIYINNSAVFQNISQNKITKYVESFNIYTNKFSTQNIIFQKRYVEKLSYPNFYNVTFLELLLEYVQFGKSLWPQNS